MFGVVFTAILPLFLLAVFRVQHDSQRLTGLMLAGYLVRIGLQLILRDLPLFSHGTGGDYLLYEWLGWHIAKLWTYQGVQFYTQEQLPDIGAAALPPNVFALVIFLNGGEATRIGCTAVIAMLAVLTCYQLYRLAVDLGADEDHCFKATAVLLFSPGFLFYTSDMFKDGLVAFFMVTALCSSFRLARRFSPTQIVILGLSLWALWYVRFYLIFLSLGPVAVGILGTGKRSFVRQLVMAAGMVAALMLLIYATPAAKEFSSRAELTFNLATQSNVRDWNRLGGSGVAFDDGGNPFGALHLKVLYTLFSPFPWQGGSVAFQIGKIDVAIWYYLAWRAIKAGRTLWREDRTLLLMFLIFLVPGTIAYATTMANIGLILRQRIPLVLIGSMLGMLSWPARAAPRPLARVPREEARPGLPVFPEARPG